MANIPTTGWETTPAAKADSIPKEGWDTGASPDIPKPDLTADTEGPMPGVGSALSQGIKAGIGESAESLEALRGQPLTAVQETSPAAAPLEWSDISSPFGKLLPKVAYGLGKSAPTLATGIAGGALGSPAGPGGTLVGGTIGAAVGSAFQTIGPVFAQELKQTPSDPDGAWTRALERAGTSGLFSGAGWALFPARFFQGPLKQFAFQALGVQPAVGVAEQATQNILQGKPAGEGLGQAYAQGAAGTALPMVGHAAIRALAPGAPPVTPTPSQTEAKPGQAPLPERVIDFSQPVPGAAPDPSTLPTDRFSRVLRGAVNQWKKSFQPEQVSDLALQADGEFRNFNARVAQRVDSTNHYMDNMHSVFERVATNPQDAIDFMKAHTKEAPIPMPPELKPYSDIIRDLLKMAYFSDRDVGAKYGFVQDYLPRLYEDPERAATFFKSKYSSMGAPGFQEKRTLDFLQDGLDQGLKLKTNNVADLVTARLNASALLQEKVRLLQRLNQMGVASKLETPGDISSATFHGWNIIKDPTGQQWAIHPDLKQIWDNVIAADQGLWNDPTIAGNVFRAWMKTKNSYVPLKLGISLFHPLHVAGIDLAQGLTQGWMKLTRQGDPVGALNSVLKGVYGQILQAPGLGKIIPTEAKAAREAWLTPEWKQTPEQKQVVKLMTEGGFSPQLAEELRGYDSRKFRDAIINQDWVKALPYGLRSVIPLMQKPFFEHWIPSLKTAAYLDEARSLFERRPDLIDDDINRKAALGAIAKSIDNRYGEMFYRNLHWNKTFKDIGVASFLSLGWNLGFLREFGGGMLEPFLRDAMSETPTRRAINDAKSKSAYALFYTASAMALLSQISYWKGGVNYQDMDLMDYILPRIGGTNPDGSPRRISNMFFTREIPMAEKHIEEKQSVLGGLQSMLWNKLMFEPFAEIINNKNYYGYNIMDEKAPWYKQVGQLIKFIFGDQMSPITISGAKRALQVVGKWDDSGTSQAWLNNLKSVVFEPEGQAALLGFGPAPAYAAKTATLNRLNYLFARYVSPQERPQVEQQVMEERRDARNALMMARQNKDTEAAAAATQKLLKLGVPIGAIKKVQPGTQDLYMFSRLPYSIQTEFLRDLSKDDFRRYYMKANKMTKADPGIRALVKKYYQSP